MQSSVADLKVATNESDDGRRRYRERASTKTEVTIFDGVNEHLAYAGTAAPDKCLHDLTTASWIGRRFSGWKEVEEAGRAPWPEGAKLTERMLREIDRTNLPKPVSIRRKLRWRDDTGDEIDLCRVRSGQDYWRSTQRQKATGPSSLTLVVQCGASAARSSEELCWRGATAAALSKLLEEAGYSVEVWALSYLHSAYANGHNSFQAVMVKDGGDYLDMHAIATVTSGWYFRTAFFNSLAANKSLTPAGGYGFHATVHRSLFEHVARRPEDVISIDHVWNLPQAVALAGKYLGLLQDGPAKIGGFEE